MESTTTNAAEIENESVEDIFNRQHAEAADSVVKNLVWLLVGMVLTVSLARIL